MDARDDGTLLEAWAAGDRAAGATLLERHHQILYRFFRNKVSSGVEDLMQQTMLACTRRWVGTGESPVFARSCSVSRGESFCSTCGRAPASRLRSSLWRPPLRR